MDELNAIVSLWGKPCMKDGDGVVTIEGRAVTSGEATQIDTEVIRLQAEYDAQEYARNRAVSFPSWQEQMDMQYHDELNGTTTWKDAVAKVKSDNPKG